MRAKRHLEIAAALLCLLVGVEKRPAPFSRAVCRLLWSLCSHFFLYSVSWLARAALLGRFIDRIEQQNIRSALIVVQAKLTPSAAKVCCPQCCNRGKVMALETVLVDNFGSHHLVLFLLACVLALVRACVCACVCACACACALACAGTKRQGLLFADL